jgi:drug/metabolite transporter (DMT)-like permease
VGPGRWFGVALGFCGVVVMLWEHLGTGDQGFSRGAIGAAMSLTAAFCVAVAMIQTSRLVQSEHMGAVVFYFQFTAGCVGLSLMLLGALWPSSWPFAGAMASLAWVAPLEPSHWALLIAAGLFGGIGQILMTRGYTLADASILACFDYVSMIWVLALGAVFLGEFPSFSVLAGAAIITIAGLLVIWSEKTKKFV